MKPPADCAQKVVNEAGAELPQGASFQPNHEIDWRPLYQEMQAARLLLDKIAISLAILTPATLELRTVDEKKRVVALIKGIVAEKYEFTFEQLTSRCRTEELAWARQVAMAMSREFTQLPTVMLGELFCRDHGTIVHSSQAVEAKCSIDQKIDKEVESVRATIRERLAISAP